MPTVQRYGPRKVDPNPYPDARKQSAETFESAGGAVAQAGIRRGQALAQVGETAFRIGASEAAKAAQEQRDRADDIMHLSTMNQLGQYENDLYSRVRQTRGQAAFALPEQTYAEYQKLTSDIEGTLTNDRQRLQFQKYAAERGLVIDHTVRSHVDQEITRYESDELKGMLVNSQNRAVGFADEPQKVQLEIRDQVAALDIHGKNLGMGPEELEEAKNATRSATHVGVIRSLIGQEKMGQAQAYFDAPGVKETIDKDQRATLEAQLHSGNKRQEAQRQADEILKAGGTLTEQLEKAAEIPDADVRHDAESYLEHKYSLKKALDVDALNSASVNAYNILDATRGDLSKVEALPQYSDFPGDLRRSLSNYADEKRNGREPRTDFATYYMLRRRAYEDPKAFMDLAKTNLNTFRDKLSPSDLKGLAELQADMKTGNDAKVLKFIGPAKMQDAVVDDILRGYGIDPNDKLPTSTAADVRAQLRARVELEQFAKQREVTSTELKHWTDEIVHAQGPVTVSHYFGLGADTIGNKPAFQVTVEEIPPGMRKEIEAALRATNQVVNDSTVLRHYRDTMVWQSLPEDERRALGQKPKAEPIRPVKAHP